MDKSLFFIAGSYGAGKTTLCKLLATKTGFISISASDLLTQITGCKYGEKKIAIDIVDNQQILIRAINELFHYHDNIIIGGHFCLLIDDSQVEILPEFIFESLYIKKIILLDIDADIICKRLAERDLRKYSISLIQQLIDEERRMAEQVALKIGCPLYVYKTTCFENYIDDLVNLLNET